MLPIIVVALVVAVVKAGVMPPVGLANIYKSDMSLTIYT